MSLLAIIRTHAVRFPAAGHRRPGGGPRPPISRLRLARAKGLCCLVFWPDGLFVPCRRSEEPEESLPGGRGSQPWAPSATHSKSSAVKRPWACGLFLTLPS